MSMHGRGRVCLCYVYDYAYAYTEKHFLNGNGIEYESNDSRWNTKSIKYIDGNDE